MLCRVRLTVLTLLLLTFSSVAGRAQVAETPESSRNVDAANSTATTQAPPDGRPVSWKLLIPNTLHDQKPIWLFPVHVAQGKHWKPTLGIVLGTAALVALDPHDTPYFRRTDSFNGVDKVFSGRNTTIATALVPLSAYAVGLAKRDSYTQQTALLAGEAVLDSEILTVVMKNIDRRLRPVDIPPDGDFTHTWFKSSGTLISGRGSFPSGHTIAAFSVATVFSQRYGRQHRWVPFVAYGLAGLVGFSRVPLQSHFPSDVFAGAALGYAISRFAVLQHP